MRWRVAIFKKVVHPMMANKARSRGLVLIMVLATVFGTACGARAADQSGVAGNWVFEAQAGLAPGPGVQPTAATNGMVIEVNNGKIKGTLTVPRGGSSPIEGTINGNEIHFIVRRQTPEGELSVEYRGAVDGDSMKGTSRVVGQTTGTDIHWTAKRQK
jgi:hypothetical protein